MININATQARAKLFQLLDKVEEGEEVVIVKKNSKKKFKVSLVKEKKKPSKEAVLKHMAKIGLSAPEPEEIRKILISRLDSDDALF